MRLKSLILSFAALVFTTIGTAGGITIMCGQFYYEPKKPAILQ